MGRDLTVCVFSRHAPDMDAFCRRFYATHIQTLTEFDGEQVPLPGGEEQYCWEPDGLPVGIYVTLSPALCRAIIPKKQASMLGVGEFVQGTTDLYELLQDAPGVRSIVPAFPWGVLDFTKGDEVYGTYFHATFDQEDYMFQRPVQEIGKVANHLAKKYDGIVYANKARMNVEVRRWLEQGSRKHVMDLVRAVR